MKTNIQFNSFDNQIKSVAVVSTDHMDGKTTTTINLAISMANSGIKVLLLDADIRKPLKYKHFADQDLHGLVGVIAGRVDFSEAVSKTNVKNLFILTSGTRHMYSSEILSSRVFDEILERAKNEYEFVIVDTPAMGSYIDGAVVASKADGVILLAKWKSTNYRSILRVKNQLEKVNARILGIVLNNVSKSEYRDYYIMNYSYDHLKTSFDYKNTGVRITSDR